MNWLVFSLLQYNVFPSYDYRTMVLITICYIAWQYNHDTMIVKMMMIKEARWQDVETVDVQTDLCHLFVTEKLIQSPDYTNYIPNLNLIIL